MAAALLYLVMEAHARQAREPRARRAHCRPPSIPGEHYAAPRSPRPATRRAEERSSCRTRGSAAGQRNRRRGLPRRSARAAGAPGAARGRALADRARRKTATSSPIRPRPGDSRPRGVPKAASAIVPASFLRLCEIVVLHSDPARFALLYRLLWRLVHEPGLRHNPVDPDMLHAHQMGQAVRRDMHKMKAFLRFRTVHDGQAESAAARLVRSGPPHRRGGGALVRAALAADALGHPHTRALGRMGHAAAALRARPGAPTHRCPMPTTRPGWLLPAGAGRAPQGAAEARGYDEGHPPGARAARPAPVDREDPLATLAGTASARWNSRPPPWMPRMPDRRVRHAVGDRRRQPKRG